MEQGSISISISDSLNLKGLVLSDHRFPGKRPTILVIHGWTSSIERYVERFMPMVEIGYVVILFDMRGHGKTGGELKKLSASDHLNDCIAAYDFIKNIDNSDSENITVFGSSYGGYLASLLTAQRSVQHLVLKAPSLVDDAHFEMPNKQVGKEMDKYWISPHTSQDNKALKALNKFKGDVLFIECEKEEVLPKQVLDSYRSVIKSDYDYELLKGADHACKLPGTNQLLIDVLTEWFVQLRDERIINYFDDKYPGKTVVEMPGLFPTEFLCEVDPTSSHQEYSRAVVIISRSSPHYHKKLVETYRVKQGVLTVFKDGKPHELRDDDEIIIEPGVIHYAIGYETLIECESRPGWTMEDHHTI